MAAEKNTDIWVIPVHVFINIDSNT